MDYKDVLENAEKVLNEGLSSVNEYPNDDVEMELLEIQQYTLDSKLQVVREALFVFARGFSTSRPLLLKMHELYSSAIDVRNKRLEEYIELSRALLDIKHIREDPMAYFQRKSKEKWESLVQDKMNLISTVSSMKNAVEGMRTKISKLEDQLENNEAQIKIEYQARLSALLEVKRIQERMKRQINKRISISSPAEKSVDFKSDQDHLVKDCNYAKIINFIPRSKDPIFLEDEIQTCQKAYSELSNEICSLKVMYSDSVPLKRFEALEEVVRALKKRRSELKDIISTLKEENKKLEARVIPCFISWSPPITPEAFSVLFRDFRPRVKIECLMRKALRQLFEILVVEENNNLHKENEETLKTLDELENGSSILVTHWNRCGEYIPGGIERWKKLTNGKNNVEKLEVLVDELEIMSVASKYYEDNVLFS